MFTRGHHNGQNIVCHLFIYFFHKPLRGLVPRVENDTVVAGVEKMIISHSTVLNSVKSTPMVVGLHILLALLAMHLYWKRQNCFFIGIAKNRLARGMNLEFSISQSRSDRTKLCGTFSRKKQIAILFQKLFSSPMSNSCGIGIHHNDKMCLFCLVQFEYYIHYFFRTIEICASRVSCDN